MGTNLIGIGTAYGMLSAKQSALKEDLSMMKEDFHLRLTELKADFAERNSELRNEAQNARTRIHQLTDVLMEIGRGKIAV